MKFYIYLIKQPEFTTPVLVSTFYSPQDRLELTVEFFFIIIIFFSTAAQVYKSQLNYQTEGKKDYSCGCSAGCRLRGFFLKKGLKN